MAPLRRNSAQNQKPQCVVDQVDGPYWCSGMLSGLSPYVADCCRRAAECHELAQLATNDADRGFYQQREKDWLLLAQTHQLVDGFDLAIEEIDRHGGVPVTQAC